MRRVFRFLGIALLSLLGLAALLAALLAYFVYAPTPDDPHLPGTLKKASITVDGLTRNYLTYVPRGLPNGMPLVMVMHGSGESAAQIRAETGYEFERLAEQYNFAVVYPESASFDWNDCSKAGDFTVNGKVVDDVAYIAALEDKLVTALHVDPKRVYATGVSAGGFMALRLALEAPTRFRAVAAVAAQVPRPENFKCQPAGAGTSVMIMNGTKDPLVPYAGGEVNLLGLFYKGGNVHSSLESGQYFADYNKIKGEPASQETTVVNGVSVERIVWRNDAATEVELVAIHDGGHGLPQAYYRRPRLLGPSPMAPDGPAIILDFFMRQRP
ncbi:MAG: alpha/beta hydrolase family esterase [Massilia sp.]